MDGQATRRLIAGNWKMNGSSSALAEIERIVEALLRQRPPADILICPPATLIARAVGAAQGQLEIGGQDCHAEVSGAYTGDISAEMLKDAGATAVIVGHSERRQMHDEDDATVAAKARAAYRAGLTAIVCVGETEKQRDGGQALAIVAQQIVGSVPKDAQPGATVLAYEPVWAIGTGRTPTSSEIVDMHAHARARLVEHLGQGACDIPILYGGSVKPANAAEILSLREVAGALVGGASLKAADFRAIFEAAPVKP